MSSLGGLPATKASHISTSTTMGTLVQFGTMAERSSCTRNKKQRRYRSDGLYISQREHSQNPSNGEKGRGRGARMHLAQSSHPTSGLHGSAQSLLRGQRETRKGEMQGGREGGKQGRGVGMVACAAGNGWEEHRGGSWMGGRGNLLH